MLLEIIDIADKRNYDINWFEDDIYEVEPNDTEAPIFLLITIYFSSYLSYYSILSFNFLELYLIMGINGKKFR